MGALDVRGWTSLPPSTDLPAWIDAVRPTASALVDDPAEQSRWLRHGGTWFAGVNLLPNDGVGRVGAGPPLPDSVLAFCASHAPPISTLDRAQVSVCYPGYPKQADEPDTAFRFRRDRFGAHLDGLLGEGTPKRRYFREYHAFILGLPFNTFDPNAAPLVVWEGSHVVLADMLRSNLGPDPASWQDIDLTDVYKETRTRIFETCAPKRLHASPGGGFLLHRFALHGVAPWATEDQRRRGILYFRPAPRRVDADFLKP